MKSSQKSKLNQQESDLLANFIKNHNLEDSYNHSLSVYLNNPDRGDFYRDCIFESIETKNDEYIGSLMFDPLELIVLLDIEVDFVLENQDKPFLVVSRLSNTEHVNKLRHSYFLNSLVELLRVEGVYDSQDFTDCRNQIESLLDVSYEGQQILYDETRREQWEAPNFLIVESYLNRLQDNLSKIRYLKEVLTECETFDAEEELDNPSSNSDEDGFAKKKAREKFITRCKIYIDKYERLYEIENLQPKETISTQPNQTKTSKHKDKTLDRVTLFLNYLFTHSKVNCHNTQKAKVIAFLTDYSENTIGDKLSALHSKADDNYINYEKDLMIVMQYFELLDLNDVIKRINNDLEI